MSKKVVRRFGCSMEAGMHKFCSETVRCLLRYYASPLQLMAYGGNRQQCLSSADNMADGDVSRNVLKIRILFMAQHFWHELCLLLCETSETELV